MEGDATAQQHFCTFSEFQSTPSAWRETTGPDTGPCKRRHFNPLPPHGGRQTSGLNYYISTNHFNPLPPHGGRHCGGSGQMGGQDFNPLPPHGGRRVGRYRCIRPENFNPLPPHGGRQGVLCRVRVLETFQSTPSAWRETTMTTATISGRNGISIHSLRMEGDIPF